MNRCCGLDVHKDSLFASLEPKTGMKSMICTYWIEMQFYLYRIPKLQIEQAYDKEDYFLHVVYGLAGQKRIVLLFDDQIRKKIHR